MSDLRELYQQVILDHNKSPRNFKELDDADHCSEGFNPLCGDHLTVYLKVSDERIEDVSFQGAGCAISKASASLMTSELKGKTIQEAQDLFKDFHNLVTADIDEQPDLEGLGKLAVFSGVREFPVRVKCATLAWHTFHAALVGNEQPVTTE
ncbi:MAG: SUF system NifU family Fe-S cluster assembly protein [Candidatus Latescibacteria bacterium]|jgi:nitrogen fixation NifU-like protein|nr:SUF system NifU family Fe-S cluster assembly protein [Candidatus Latescibacterota bacterium]